MSPVIRGGGIADSHTGTRELWGEMVHRDVYKKFPYEIQATTSTINMKCVH